MSEGEQARKKIFSIFILLEKDKFLPQNGNIRGYLFIEGSAGISSILLTISQNNTMFSIS